MLPDGVLNHVGDVISTSVVVVVGAVVEVAGWLDVVVGELDPLEHATMSRAAASRPATAIDRRRTTDYSMRRPLMLRLITSRWISLVPSKIVKIFASRCQRSTGYSRV